MSGDNEKDAAAGREKSGGKKVKFADIVVTVCLLAALSVAGAVIYEYHHLAEPIPSDVLAEIFGFITAELGILAGRQVVGPDALRYIAKRQSKSSNDGSEDSDIFGGSI